MAGWNQGGLPEEPVARNERVSKIPVPLLLRWTYSLFRSGFWRHFMTAWPPSVLSVLVYAAGETVVRNIFSGVRHGLIGPGGAEFQRRLLIAGLEALPVRLFEFGLPWIMTTFAFAAVSSGLLRSSPENKYRIVDAYTTARDRRRPILAIGCITFGLTLVGGVIGIFCASALGGNRLIPPEHRILAVQTLLWVCLGGWLTLVSRLALSVPCIMDNLHVTTWSAIKTSYRFSEGYERLFLVFVAQTIALSLLIPFVENRLLFLLWEHNVSVGTAYQWIVRCLYSILTAVLETSIFIGFTVLYIEVKGSHKENDQDEVSSGGISATALSPR